MTNLTLKTYNSTYLSKLADFFKIYRSKYPDAKLNSPEFYTYHPALKDTENVLCVLDTDEKIIGFAPLFPAVTTNENGVTGPHVIWTIILASPDLTDGCDVRDLLFKGVSEKAQDLKNEYGLSQIKLAADMMVSQKADIDYLLEMGFVVFEEIFVMSRDISEAILPISLPDGVTVQRTKLETEKEQETYIRIYNTCFPEIPKTAEDLRFLLTSANWEKGSAFTAHAPSGEWIGSVLEYYNEENASGMTDDVMVLPDWRGKNIAKRLIGEGLGFFKAKQVDQVLLEVKATNTPAVSVYSSMGYKIINRENLLEKMV